MGNLPNPPRQYGKHQTRVEKLISFWNLDEDLEQIDHSIVSLDMGSNSKNGLLFTTL